MNTQSVTNFALQDLIAQSAKEATVHAYNDLFMLIGIGATVGFVYTSVNRLYFHLTEKIFLGKELAALANVRNKNKRKLWKNKRYLLHNLRKITRIKNRNNLLHNRKDGRLKNIILAW